MTNEVTLDTARQALREAIHRELNDAATTKNPSDARDRHLWAMALMRFASESNLFDPRELCDWSGVVWQRLDLADVASKYGVGQEASNATK